MIFGIGVYKDKFYVDVWEFLLVVEFVKVWEDGLFDLYMYFKDIENGFKNGNIFIIYFKINLWKKILFKIWVLLFGYLIVYFV